MPSDMTGKTLQVLDLMLEFFADDNHWARGCYHDLMAATAVSVRSFISLRSRSFHARQ